MIIVDKCQSLDRMTKSAWCIFGIIILLLCATNVVLFFRLQITSTHIKTVEDLARQTEIRYGTIRNSSTMAFFKTSTFTIFKDMWNFMEQHKDNVFVSSNREGIEKVRQSNGKYAFITESTLIDYANERLPCETMRLGENLDTKSYGIATPVGSYLREEIGKAVLELKQNGFLELLKRKWYNERSECRNFKTNETKRKIISGLISIGIMCYILIMSISIWIIICVFEFLLKIKIYSNQSNQTTGHNPS